MRSRRARLLVQACVTLLASVGMVGVAATNAGAATTTVISLTFDDGQATHYDAMTAMAARSMVGTFYINSGLVGSSSYYLTWPQVHAIADAGNEIGGHTVHHVNLTTVNSATAHTEVCDDRTALLNQGFSPVSAFAYPEAAVNATAKQAVQDCGYSSGRGVGSLFGSQCPCPYAETVPPPDPYNLRTADGATTSTTLADLQASVTNAETHGGGWVSLVFHGICDNQCTGGNSVSTSIFTSFLDWLAPRSGNGTVVRTVGQALGGSGPPPPPPTPTTSIACNGAACSPGWYRSTPVTISMSTSPSGASTRYTTDGSDPATSGTRISYTGPFALSSTATVRYQSSTDGFATAEAVKTQLVQIDAAAPSVAMTSPANLATFRRGDDVPLAVSAADTGSSGLAQVAYFVDGGTRAIAVVTAAPYAAVWKMPKNTSVGIHTLTAVATDRAGNTTTSAGVRVTVLK